MLDVGNIGWFISLNLIFQAGRYKIFMAGVSRLHAGLYRQSFVGLDGLRARFLFVGVDHGCGKACWNNADWIGIRAG